MAMLKSDEDRAIYNNSFRHPIKTKKYLETVVNPSFRKTLDQFWISSKEADVLH